MVVQAIAAAETLCWLAQPDVFREHRDYKLEDKPLRLARAIPRS